MFAPHDATVEDKPGLQFYPDQVESSDPTINFYGSSAKSQDGTVDGRRGHRAGTSTTARPDTTASKERFDHTFPGPGTYDVTATVTGSNAKTRSWSQTIVIDPPLAASAELTYRSNKKASLSVTGTGGQGTLVSAQWTCQDGTEVSGLTVDCPGQGERARPRSRSPTAPETRRRPRSRSSRRRSSRSRSSPRRRRSRPASRRRSRSESIARAARAASGAKVCLSVKGKASVNPPARSSGPRARQVQVGEGEAEAEEEGEGQAEDQGDGHLEGCRQGIGVREDEGEEKALWLASPCGTRGSGASRARTDDLLIAKRGAAPRHVPRSWLYQAEYAAKPRMRAGWIAVDVGGCRSIWALEGV